MSGRNDGNIKVLLPAGSLPTGVDSSEEKPIKFGDYVAVRVSEFVLILNCIINLKPEGFVKIFKF